MIWNAYSDLDINTIRGITNGLSTQTCYICYILLLIFFVAVCNDSVEAIIDRAIVFAAMLVENLKDENPEK